MTEPDTGSIIFEVPSEAIPEVAKNIEAMKGIIFDKKLNKNGYLYLSKISFNSSTLSPLSSSSPIISFDTTIVGFN